MPTLTNYTQFNGFHWETGTIRNYWDYVGIKAPHTGQPYSEALLMGVSGGAVMGYFSFAYAGYPPHVALLTRNTFDPMERLLQRLGVVQNVLHTSKPEKGRQNLLDTLADGTPAIVWADMFGLPYNALKYDDGWWAMMPILVYGYDESADTVHIADRAAVPLTVSTGELAAARARVKKDKFRVLTLDMPDPDKLAEAVSAGIWDAINLFTEKPPKGSRNNFGLQAFEWWAKLLTQPKQRMSWEKEFPTGPKMVAGLTTTYNHIMLFGKSAGVTDDAAERLMYADFLDEASVILNKPDLQTVANQFRRSAAAWRALANMLLPDEIAPFKQIRELKLRIHQLFLQNGGAALAQRRAQKAQLQALEEAAGNDFPLDAAGVTNMRAALAEQVLAIRGLEEKAVMNLRSAMI
ncbi:MAG: BtrH N-terminal domain-containing protein [Caldilineaceae bacterium]